MPSITIRDVPQEARDELAAQAARAGQSMQTYLRSQLIDLAGRESKQAVIARARERAKRLGLKVSAEQILAARDADRP